jgi:hypothetical protein
MPSRIIIKSVADWASFELPWAVVRGIDLDVHHVLDGGLGIPVKFSRFSVDELVGLFGLVSGAELDDTVAHCIIGGPGFGVPFVGSPAGIRIDRALIAGIRFFEPLADVLDLDEDVLLFLGIFNLDEVADIDTDALEIGGYDVQVS